MKISFPISVSFQILLVLPLVSQEIVLTEEQRRTIHPEVMVLEQKIARYPLAVPGVCQPAAGHVAAISSPLAGRLHHVRVQEGNWVHRGDVLVEMESMELAALVAEFLKAKGQETYLSKRVERVTQLVEKRISPQGTLEQLQSELQLVKTTLQALNAQLRTIGFEDRDVHRINQDPLPRLKLKAPIDGVVSESLVIEGAAVEPHQKLFTVLNPNQLTVKGFVSPEDSPNLRAGLGVTILKMQNQEIQLHSKLDRINPSLDPNNRAIAILSNIQPESGWPSVGEPVRMIVDVSTLEPLIAIPEKAIFYDGDQAAVFVESAPGRYRLEHLFVRPLSGGMVQMVKGPAVGSKIVISQIFTLKALNRISDYGEE